MPSSTGAPSSTRPTHRATGSWARQEPHRRWPPTGISGSRCTAEAPGQPASDAANGRAKRGAAEPANCPFSVRAYARVIWGGRASNRVGPTYPGEGDRSVVSVGWRLGVFGGFGIDGVSCGLARERNEERRVVVATTSGSIGAGGPCGGRGGRLGHGSNGVGVLPAGPPARRAASDGVAVGLSGGVTGRWRGGRVLVAGVVS